MLNLSDARRLHSAQIGLFEAPPIPPESGHSKTESLVTAENPSRALRDQAPPGSRFFDRDRPKTM